MKVDAQEHLKQQAARSLNDNTKKTPPKKKAAKPKEIDR